MACAGCSHAVHTHRAALGSIVAGAARLGSLAGWPLLRFAGSTLAATAAARKRLGPRVGSYYTEWGLGRGSQAEDTGCGWMSRCWAFMGKGG